MNLSSRPEKLAVLGGGIASLSAVFELTSQPGWQTRYDITVYQLGWRLGGKGASSRNPAAGDRIEEHGLHILMGFYENTHALMRRCYAELARPAQAPLARWDDAFKPHDFVLHQERHDDRWIDWPVEQEPTPGEPGDGSPIPGTRDYLERLVAYVDAQYEDSPVAGLDDDAAPLPEPLPRPLQARLTAHGAPQAPSPRAALALARTMIARWAAAHDGPSPADRDLVVALLERFRGWFRDAIGPLRTRHVKGYQAWTAADYALTIACGMLRDDVVDAGFDPLDDEEFTAWMRRHGADESTLRSALCRAIYVLAFAYRGGREETPDIGAGTGLRTVLRLTFGYKRAVFWLMQAGMGETVFAPLYQVLLRRGVRFRFFHRVERLRLDPDGRGVAAIEVAEQATVRDGEYAPLVDVDGLPCWPHEPRHEQLVEGEALRSGAINLESWWTPWRDPARRVLRRGIEFDRALLGIPVSCLRELCGELVERLPRWRAMVDHLEAIQTQGVQLWLRRDAAALGWVMPRAVASNGDGSLNVWADMSHLLPRERWRDDDAPRHLVYFCGAMPAPAAPASRDDHEFPAREVERVRAGMERWLAANAARTWPDSAALGGFDWDLLIDPARGVGPARLSAQVARANIDPTELYVLSVHGTLRHRLRCDESGLDNLVLAGDWVRTGLNIGCIEAAVMSGMQAARALGGVPRVVVGEDDR